MAQDGDDAPSIERRLDALEAEVAALRRALGGRPAESAAPAPPSAASAATPTESVAGKARRAAFEDGRWLNQLGIGLLLFGVAFLFKYSIDQGWLTPWVRVSFGFVLAAGLLAVGNRLAAERATLARVLSGGAVATLYITTFAAFQLYGLIPHGLAFALMVGATVLSFALAVRHDAAVHSLIGTVGGFGTPFLLHTGESNLPALVAYACTVLAGATAIFLRRGWRVLHWTAAVGVAGVLAIAIGALEGEGATADRLVVQAGIAFAALCAWIVPVARLRASNRDPRQFAPTTVGLAEGRISVRPLWPHPHMLVISTALATLAASSATWDLGESSSGWLGLALAAAWLAAGGALHRGGARDGLFESHLVAGGILTTLATALLLDGDVLLVGLAAEAAGFHWLAQRLRSAGPGLLGHLLFLVVGASLLGRFGEGIPDRSLLDGAALAELFAIVALGAVGWRTGARGPYPIAAHVGFLGWMLRELGDLDNGQAVVTAAWVAYSVGLLLLAQSRQHDGLRRAALATFLLIAAKLFVVDLDEVDPIWRILSFLGFGGVLLALSYLFPSLWKREPERDG